MKRALYWFLAVAFLSSSFPSSSSYAVQPPEEEAVHTHEEALSVATEDPVLKEQIVKVTEGLEQLHEQMAQRRQALNASIDEVQKTALYAELDGLRKEHDMLERLLHELVDEATATEWTKIDEALKRARRFEWSQEEAYQKEENLRERKQ